MRKKYNGINHENINDIHYLQQRNYSDCIIVLLFDRSFISLVDCLFAKSYERKFSTLEVMHLSLNNLSVLNHRG